VFSDEEVLVNPSVAEVRAHLATIAG